MIIVTTSSGRHWQSRTELVSAPVLRTPPAPGSRVVSGLRWRRRLLRVGDGGLAPLPGWMLGSGRCRGCSLLLKCLGAGWEGAAPCPPPASPALMSWGLCWGSASCPGAAVLSPMGAPANYGFFFFTLFVRLFVFCFFFFFLAANFPLQMPWRKQDRAQEAAAPRGISVGHRVPRSLGWMEPQRTGTAQCLGEHTAAWDRQGKTRILQNEDKQELSSGACGGNGPRVCSHWCSGLAWLRQLRRTAAWPLR